MDQYSDHPGAKTSATDPYTPLPHCFAQHQEGRGALLLRDLASGKRRNMPHTVQEGEVFRKCLFVCLEILIHLHLSPGKATVILTIWEKGKGQEKW